jgi:photosystem I P700 chlorophyll a apoprotein A2
MFVVAFGTPEKQILIETVFAQFIQASTVTVLYGFDTLLSTPIALPHCGCYLTYQAVGCHQQRH